MCLPPSEPSPDLGIRYRAMLPPTELHGLSSATSATLRHFDTAFVTQERGGVRDGNDKTNCINDLSDLAECANSPMSAQQIIDLTYVIFAKQPILQPDLRLWNRKPLADRTWDNMMVRLISVRSPRQGTFIINNPPHQANVATMADLVAQRLLDDRCLLPYAHEGSMAPPEPPVLPATAQEPPPTAPYPDVDNILQRCETDLQTREASMMTQMQDMMASMLRAGNNNNGNHNNGHGNNNHNGNNNHPPRNNRNTNGRTGGCGTGHTNNTSRPAPNTHLYCWSHGACVHASPNCNRQAFGHQGTATFSDMQNGSTNGCYWM
jgi:hypothetical protein